MNPNIETNIFAQRDMWSGNIAVLVKQIDARSLKVYHGVLSFVEVPEATSLDLMRPTLQLDQTRAQRLMDELWHCGLRPSEGTGSAGALAATQAHLKDMQTLTFKLIERTSPARPE
jgi:hypothetical protein